ncbi:zinc finger protein 346-like isoform X2 [Anneissia japonica]|uniref:zinc finger protein 346-like isoform X2 n=1 Tax=Anneissia japonica TaxID=1529436 RepID=UPI001425AAC9|nr:zinc finger protein 346-like isoform X2 [Anneissia japonica]
MKIKRRLYKTMIMAIPPCKVCKLTFTSEAHASQHYRGQKHEKKVKMAENLHRVDTASTEQASDVGCKICNVVYSSEIQRQDHISGKQHQNACQVYSDLQQGNQLYCEYCNKHFTKMDNKVEHEATPLHKIKKESKLLESTVPCADETLPNCAKPESSKDSEARANIDPISNEDSVKVVPIGSKFTKDNN